MREIAFTNDQLRAAFPNVRIQTPELGQGSFKVAYLIADGDDRRVLKILTDPLVAEENVEDFTDAELPDRVARELDGMAQVESDHVVKILAAPSISQIGSDRYVSYEEPYFPGGTLADRLKDGPLSEADTRALVVALLTAVKDLWSQRGIVHRDIKPGNIVFDASGLPVLLDLGIALYTALSELTESHAQSPRTNIYAAPEQFEIRRMATIDYRTDLFQIGIVGYQALTGRHPFLEPGVASLEKYVEALWSGEPVSFDGVSCSPELQEVLTRLMAHRPNGRYRLIEEPLSMLGVGA